jgi:hypothetical protein
VHLRQTPAEQETVLLTISRVNGLHLLRRAHSALADMNQVPTEVTDAIRDDKPLPDARLDALSTFTASLVESRGLPTAAEVEGFLAEGFTETDILRVLLAVCVKAISDYTNHLFHTSVDTMLTTAPGRSNSAQPEAAGRVSRDGGDCLRAVVGPGSIHRGCRDGRGSRWSCRWIRGPRAS